MSKSRDNKGDNVSLQLIGKRIGWAKKQGQGFGLAYELINVRQPVGQESQSEERKELDAKSAFNKNVRMMMDQMRALKAEMIKFEKNEDRREAANILLDVDNLIDYILDNKMIEEISKVIEYSNRFLTYVDADLQLVNSINRKDLPEDQHKNFDLLVEQHRQAAEELQRNINAYEDTLSYFVNFEVDSFQKEVNSFRAKVENKFAVVIEPDSSDEMASRSFFHNEDAKSTSHLIFASLKDTNVKQESALSSSNIHSDVHPDGMLSAAVEEKSKIMSLASASSSFIDDPSFYLGMSEMSALEAPPSREPPPRPQDADTAELWEKDSSYLKAPPPTRAASIDETVYTKGDSQTFIPLAAPAGQMDKEMLETVKKDDDPATHVPPSPGRR